ncbi:MAG: hypothetical protein E7Z91_05280 [Cyanobacteria bacterium SIG30]|nr:hypothetical protein [Cyanobacteria bacterium SIG30]
MQINKINNTQNFGMAYKIDAGAAKKLKKVIVGNKSALANIQATKKIFENVPDILEIKDTRPSKLFGRKRLLIKYTKPETGVLEQHISPKRFAKKTSEVIQKMNADIMKAKYKNAKKAVADELASSSLIGE